MDPAGRFDAASFVSTFMSVCPLPKLHKKRGAT
ncbi:hypothetical protein CHKEEEPN_2479 [Methylorubrum podarium]|nr:hypothetical protein CHKEEEPN_2479 [Methylorubrum podarium]